MKIIMLFSIIFVQLYMNYGLLFSRNSQQLSTILNQSISGLLNSGLYQQAMVGIDITRTDNGESLFSIHSGMFFKCASTFKIIVAGVSLLYLGPDRYIETSLGIDGEITNGTLSGNLYLVGHGDPMLTVSNLDEAAAALEKSGLHQINGDLIYDTAYLDEENSMIINNARHLYTPSGALNLNYNWILLDLTESVPAGLTAIPDTRYAQIDCNIKVIKSKFPGKPEMKLKEYPWGDYYTIQGNVTDWDKTYSYLRLGVSRPGLYTATVFKEICAKHNLILTGGIRKSEAHIPVKTLINMRSKTIREAARVMNQESNNMIAETLNKILGAEFVSIPGTKIKGVQVLRNFIAGSVGLSKETLQLSDACGLSPDTRLSPEQFTTILNYFYQKKEIHEPFMASLPWQGHQKQTNFIIPPDNIQVYIKSGTLPDGGVNNYAGYIVLPDSGESFSFAIMITLPHPQEPVYSGTLTAPILTALVKSFESYLTDTNGTK